ncbi:MAG TPA: hypothetical protein VGR26_04475 [Acidimicrobiales bacterium]|nr:hypothetical protein [Acidimicrobiales bacterium]
MSSATVPLGTGRWCGSTTASGRVNPIGRNALMLEPRGWGPWERQGSDWRSSRVPDPDRCSARAALTAAVLANAGVAAVLVFGASMANLAAKLELSGFPWHAVATAGLSSEDASEATVAGERTQVLETQAKGSVGLTVVEGRRQLPTKSQWGRRHGRA